MEAAASIVQEHSADISSATDMHPDNFHTDTLPSARVSIPTSFLYNSDILRQNLRNILLMSGFFFGITVVRWLFRTYKRSEFDEYPPDQMIQICKFCQIIKD